MLNERSEAYTKKVVYIVKRGLNLSKQGVEYLYRTLSNKKVIDELNGSVRKLSFETVKGIGVYAQVGRVELLSSGASIETVMKVAIALGMTD